MYKKHNYSGSNGQIQGRVTDAHFITPLKGIRVHACLQNIYSIDPIKEVNTDENGDYLITDLFPDTYCIVFCDQSGKYLNKEYGKRPAGKPVSESRFDSKECFKYIRHICSLIDKELREETLKNVKKWADSMQKVIVTAGNTTKVQDMCLSPYGQTKGQFNDSFSLRLDHLWSWWDNYYTLDIDMDGKFYFINSLEYGAYKVPLHHKHRCYNIKNDNNVFHQCVSLSSKHGTQITQLIEELR